MLLLKGRISPSPSPPLPPKYDFMCNRPFRFERNCGKMYSRHLFPYGGLAHVIASYSSDQTSVQYLNI